MRSILVAAAIVAVAASARAQPLPGGPISLAGGAVTLSGDLSAAVAPADDEAWFNYGDYDHDTMRAVRLGLAVAIRPARRLALLASLRAESDVTRGDWYVRPYALYARIRPWTGRPVFVQAGQLPPTFGAFGRRVYANENPLVGLPLAYQYLTSLRADAVPASADDLLKMRGRGWRVRYPVGAPTAAAGVPLVDLLHYDTGLQAGASRGGLSLVVGLTQGSLSRPLARDDNRGRQLAARLGWQPVPGLAIGLSAARGAFLSRALTSALPASAGRNAWAQRAIGADVEWTAGYWIVRAEVIGADWRLPSIADSSLARPLGAIALDLEARYKIRPGLFAAARAGHLGFSSIRGSAGRLPWDAPVTRVEAGLGYSLQPHLLLKVVGQDNRRQGGRFDRHLRLLAAQLAWWF